MGILGRINTVIKSNVNEMLDKMSDPAKEIDMLVMDMESSVKKGKEEVITCVAQAKRAAMRCDDLQGEVDTWIKRAEAAVRAGDDALAREALQEKMNAEQQLEDARKLQREQEEYADQLKASLKELEKRVTQVKARKESLKERARAAKEGRAGLKGGKAFDDFARLEDRIEAMESEVDLGEQLDARDAATAAKFAHLEEKDPKVEDALAELKRKMEQGE